MRILGRPTLDVLLIVVVVHVVQRSLALLAPTLAVALFALPGELTLVPAVPWTAVTSVYAHQDLAHLLGNATMLVPVGLAVERVTTRWRYHAFFVVVGALAGLSQVVFNAVVFSLGGDPPGVLGASGAVLGLLGYFVAGNPVTDTVVRGFELDAKVQLAAIGVVGAALALALAGAGVANVGHFTGLVLGLLAGRLRLLHVDEGPDEAEAAGA